MRARPAVSVVVLNYNTRDLLRRCIESLLRTRYDNFNVIVVDNGSTDGSVALLKSFARRSKRIKLLLNRQNLGFAEGNNVALRRCRGKYVVLLNSDTEVTPSWLEKLVNAAKKDSRIGAAQAKLLLHDRTIDSIGSFLTQFGFLYHRYIGDRDPRLIGVEEVFSTKAAALLLRRDLIERIGLFDPDYFAYNEEMDLCWRIWLSGHKVVVVHDSVVRHLWGGTVSRLSHKTALYLVAYHGTKNYIQTLLKNAELRNLTQILPMYILLRLVLAVALIMRRPRRCGISWDLVYVLKGIAWVLLNFRRVWTKRLFIQHRIRTLPDEAIWPKVTRRVPISYLLKIFLIGSGRDSDNS